MMDVISHGSVIYTPRIRPPSMVPCNTNELTLPVPSHSDLPKLPPGTASLMHSERNNQAPPPIDPRPFLPLVYVHPPCAREAPPSRWPRSSSAYDLHHLHQLSLTPDMVVHLIVSTTLPSPTLGTGERLKEIRILPTGNAGEMSPVKENRRPNQLGAHVFPPFPAWFFTNQPLPKPPGIYPPRACLNVLHSTLVSLSQERHAPATIHAVCTTVISSALTTPVCVRAAITVKVNEGHYITSAGTHPLGVPSGVTIMNATSLIISDIDIPLSNWESATSDC
ncbi:hypothetical protein JB92DRAFT_3174475 [Gautieria morchelliformis]|nr:hypothetical protein JB92DRAFT_3174475 [Gautieria morchelliformis]